MSDTQRFDFGSFARRAQEVQLAVAEVQRDLESVEATGHGGSGLVSATLSGQGQLVDLRIDPSLFDPQDPDALTEFVVAAVNAALAGAVEQRTALMSGLTSGLAGMADGLQRPGSGVEPRRPNRPW